MGQLLDPGAVPVTAHPTGIGDRGQTIIPGVGILSFANRAPLQTALGGISLITYSAGIGLP